MRILYLTLLLALTLAKQTVKTSHFEKMLNNFKKVYQEEQNMSCDQQIDNLLLDITNLGTIFYALGNGKYMGSWGDYETCMMETTNGTFVLAQIDGTQANPEIYTRSG